MILQKLNSGIFLIIWYRKNNVKIPPITSKSGTKYIIPHTIDITIKIARLYNKSLFVSVLINLLIIIASLNNNTI